MEFNTIEDVWQLQTNYRGQIGSDVQKLWFNKSKKDGMIFSTRFIYNKEGRRKEDK